jgi:23S rRNA (uracil1939-C5)-methyltransferase
MASLAFAPGDFIQVNGPVNQRMVEQALSGWTQARMTRCSIFCGIGNHLPLARQAREVVGVEGELAMVARAEENARRNGINNARFYKADLSGDIAGMSGPGRVRSGTAGSAQPGALEVMERRGTFPQTGGLRFL